MFPTFKKWFVPCEENSFLPYTLRAASFLFLSVTIGAAFAASSTVGHLLVSKNSFLGAVVASVLVDLTNGDRAAEGLPSLAVNPRLLDAAQHKANDMAARNYFSHTAPDGTTPWYWFEKAGYTFSYAGENLAVFFGDSSDVERAWMDSSSHRANILNERFTEIGIATAEGFYEGERTVFVVQMFGAPTVSKPAATIASTLSEGDRPPIKEAAPNEAGGGGDIENKVSVEPSVLYEDETFIAVKGDTRVAPSASAAASQSTALERALGSPRTLLAYAYGFIGLVVAFSLASLVFFESRTKRIAPLFFALLFFALMSALLYSSGDPAIVAQAFR